MDYLDRIVSDVQQSIRHGYYQSRPQGSIGPKFSFVQAIAHCSEGKNAIIAELKPASPSEGILLKKNSTDEMLSLYVQAGVSGLSILTEPQHFGGSLENLRHASLLGLPTLTKDFVICTEQLDAARAYGASGVLLIATLFERDYASLNLDAMISEAQKRELEVLLEVASLDEYERALKTNATMIGINNRDLTSLKIDLNRTADILGKSSKDRLIWSLSGVDTREDLQKLRDAGADAFLVGTSLLKAKDPQVKLAELLSA
ncbi:indole-3-glycerol-phosphate synthase [Candidatus Acetothermia bacterium]|nr:indole-3-glycerol-phosphate synthase [Candidatus Acetothermia bacterium]